MKKISLLLALLVPAAQAAMAYGDAEFGRGLAVLKAEVTAGAPEIRLPEPSLDAVIVKQGKSEYVRVSGYLSLTGTGWMQQDGGYTFFSFSGWTTVRDSSGKVTSNSVSVSFSDGVWVRPNQYVHHSVRPNVSVSLYKDGKYAGSTTVSGYIPVSGWANSSYIHLNGSGYLEGSIYITE